MANYRVLNAGKKRHSSSSLLSSDESVLKDHSAKMESWHEHFSTALNKPPVSPSEHLLHYANVGIPDNTISLESPTLAEIVAAV